MKILPVRFTKACPRSIVKYLSDSLLQGSTEKIAIELTFTSRQKGISLCAVLLRSSYIFFPIDQVVISSRWNRNTLVEFAVKSDWIEETRTQWEVLLKIETHSIVQSYVKWLQSSLSLAVCLTMKLGVERMSRKWTTTRQTD